MSGYSGTWSPWNIANWNIYQPLIDGLNRAGYEPIPYYYDWRQPIPPNASQLRSFIQANSPPDEKVDLIGHSQGGLVGRAYLEYTQTISRLDKFLTVGSPHRGSVLSYPVWSGGEMWIVDPKFRIAFTLMKTFCALRRGWTPLQTAQNALASSQNILPIFDYLKNTSGSFTPVNSMAAKNNWLPTTFSSPFYGVTVGTLGGTGYNTLRTLEVQPRTRTDQILGKWRDGKPTGNAVYADGDGTVLLESSLLPDAQHTVLPLDHTGLVASPSGISAIINFLNGNNTPQPLALYKQQDQLPVKHAKNITALVVVVDGVHATLTDKDGNIFQDSDGQITILNPSDEAYTLTVTTPKMWWWKTRYKVVVIQLFEDGTSKWKEYSRKDFWKKRFRLRFDRKDKHEDILDEKLVQ